MESEEIKWKSYKFNLIFKTDDGQSFALQMERALLGSSSQDKLENFLKLGRFKGMGMFQNMDWATVECEIVEQ